MTSGTINVRTSVKKMLKDGSTNAEIKAKLPMVKLTYLRRLRESMKGNKKMNIFYKAAEMIREGYTNKEVSDALDPEAFDRISELRTLMRRFDDMVPTEYDAREQRLNRITEGINPTEHMRVLLRQGLSNEAIQAAIIKKFPTMPMALVRISQERLRRRRLGENIPRNPDIKS